MVLARGMRGFRIHRSLLFWLGIPGLLFLLWAWRDSMHSGLRLSRHYGIEGPGFGLASEDLWINSFDGVISGGAVEVTITDAAYRWKREETRFTRYPVHSDGKLFKGFEWGSDATEEQGYTGKHRFICVPFWSGIPAYLAGWWGLIGWRCFQLRRKGATPVEGWPGEA